MERILGPYEDGRKQARIDHLYGEFVDTEALAYIAAGQQKAGPDEMILYALGYRDMQHDVLNERERSRIIKGFLSFVRGDSGEGAVLRDGWCIPDCTAEEVSGEQLDLLLHQFLSMPQEASV